MKKAIMGAGALLAASILPAVSVFAVDPLDYAKSVGSIGGADTINWVVEATSDGGYVVGGQTMGCYRHEDGVALASAHADNDDGELVEWSKCEEYYSNMPMSTFEAKGKRNISIMDICAGDDGPFRGNPGVEGKVKAAEDEDDYWYNAVCIDYIAKFQKDGTKEWLTLVNDNSRPIAVKETSSEYRMVVKNSTVYSFAKTGTKGLSNQLENNPYIGDAAINGDGSVVVAGDNGLCYYDENLDFVRCAGQNNDNKEYSAPSLGGGIIKVEDDYLLVERAPNDNGGYDVSVVKVSDDLKTITPILDVGDGFMGILFSNGGGDFATVNCEGLTDQLSSADDSDANKCSMATYDKDGEKVAEKNMDDLGIDSISVAFPKDFVIIQDDGKLVRIDRNLNITFEHTLDENETLNDVAPLNDNSVVGVGVSTGTTDNYEVDTSANGVYLRLDAPESEKETPAEGGNNVKNPGTLDAIQLFVGLGGIVLLVGAIAGRKLVARR